MHECMYASMDVWMYGCVDVDVWYRYPSIGIAKRIGTRYTCMYTDMYLYMFRVRTFVGSDGYVCL